MKQSCPQHIHQPSTTFITVDLQIQPPIAFFMENLFAKIWTFLCEEKRVKIVSGEEKSHRRVILKAIISAI